MNTEMDALEAKNRRLAARFLALEKLVTEDHLAIERLAEQLANRTAMASGRDLAAEIERLEKDNAELSIRASTQVALTTEKAEDVLRLESELALTRIRLSEATELIERARPFMPPGQNWAPVVQDINVFLGPAEPDDV